LINPNVTKVENVAASLAERFPLCYNKVSKGENARAGLTPDSRNLKPMLGEGFITPDDVHKKELFSK